MLAGARWVDITDGERKRLGRTREYVFNNNDPEEEISRDKGKEC